MRERATTHVAEPTNFAQLGVAPFLLEALDARGYVTPTPIQAKTIPVLLAGRDLLGQAQTGTGKTAAFAVPILSGLEQRASHQPQCLVLVPTRELALQVTQSFRTYGANMAALRVLPIYGGTAYREQLRALRDGVHVVVGTPGRVMDHIERGTLDLGGIKVAVLDEADEMLRMGFVDDVTWILQRTPQDRQTALFSATMPTSIERIAAEHLINPAVVTTAGTGKSAQNIEQYYVMVSERDKPEAIARILEIEPHDGAVVFVRTRETTSQLAAELSRRGFSCGTLHGDLAQAQREHTVACFKRGAFDILIATDVAARGLDVQRIDLVCNYAPPHDREAYVHRIGRTGRAGRTGKAILFLTPKERHFLKRLGRIGQPQSLVVPKGRTITKHRVHQFKERIVAAMDHAGTSAFVEIIQDLHERSGKSLTDIAAALAALSQKDVPLFVKEDIHPPIIRESGWETPRRNNYRRRGPPRGAAPARNTPHSDKRPRHGGKLAQRR